VTNLLVAAVVLLAVALGGARLLGFQVYTVLSGSMEPTYRTGSLLYVRSIDAESLKSGDVITFLLDEDTVATHRIIEVSPDENDPAARWFTTKGDANQAADGARVHSNNVLGRPVFSIPYLGRLASYIQTPPGMYVAIAVGALLLALVVLSDALVQKPAAKRKSPRRG